MGIQRLNVKMRQFSTVLGRPEGEIGIAQRRHCEAARGGLGLAGGAQCLEEEARQISPGSHAEARDRYERHVAATTSTPPRGQRVQRSLFCCQDETWIVGT